MDELTKLDKELKATREKRRALVALARQRERLLPALEAEVERIGRVTEPLLKRQAELLAAATEIRSGTVTSFRLRPRKPKEVPHG